MLIEHDYGSTVVARDRVLCLKILRAAMHAQMLEDPTLAEHFERRMRERLLACRRGAAPDRRRTRRVRGHASQPDPRVPATDAASA